MNLYIALASGVILGVALALHYYPRILNVWESARYKWAQLKVTLTKKD